MQTITTYDAHGGTAVKHEQPGSCSTKYGNKNNRTNHGGGIARRLMPLLLLVFTLVGGTAWGQTNVNMTSNTNNGSTTMQCGTTYTLTLSNQNGDRQHTFTNSNGGIYVEEFTFYGVMKVDLTRTRTRTRENRRDDWGNWSDWSSLTTNNTFDYLTVGENVYGISSVSYSGLEPIEQSSTNISNGYNSDYGEYFSTEHEQTETTTTYYRAEFTIPSISVNNATSQLVFSYTENTGYNSNTNRAGFTATIKPICCPVLTAPADGANISSGSNVEFSWEAYTDATSYDVVLDGATIANVTATTATSYTYTPTPTPALAAGDHTWKVVNNNNLDYGHCPTRSFKVCTSAPSCATNISLEDEAVLNNRLVIWDAVECATSYEVFVAPISIPVGSMFIKENEEGEEDEENGEYKYLVGEPTEPQFMMPILPEGEYRWVVRPKNDLGVATRCEMRTFKVEYQSADGHAVTPSTQGTEFFFSLMENGFDDRSTSMDKYTAIIAPKEDATVTFHYYANGTEVEYTVSAGTTMEIPLSKNLVYHPDVGDTYKKRTVRVTSTADISLYIANEAENSFDASIVLPTTALGADYMIQTFPNSDETTYPRYACFMVIATEDDTEIEISGSNSSHINPDSLSVILDKGESYFVKSTTNASTNNDLSGIKISVKHRDGHPEDECKTIAVFNGNTLTGVPTSMNNNHDHLVEQAYPISNWGTKFAITSTDGYETGVNNRPDADYIRITAAEATSVTINDGTTTSFTLAASATQDYTLNRSTGSCFIETEKPVACYLYQRSATSGNPNDEMGDPSMVWIAPIERGIEEITFSTFAATEINPEDHWVNIVIPIEAISDGQAVMLKRPNGTEENIRSSFMTGTNYNYVAGSGNKYAYARVKIDHGTYTLRSIGGGKMVVHVYGLGEVRGYAYAAGSEAVPYSSNFMVGNNSGENVLDVSLLDDDHHFCGSTTYHFSVNSNATNVDSVRIDFGDGTIKTIIASSENKYVDHKYDVHDDFEEYEIEARVYSTVYDNELCQENVVVDIIHDVVLEFAPSQITIRDTVCKGTSYVYTDSIFKIGDNGEKVFDHIYRFPSNGDPEWIIEEHSTKTDDKAKTSSGCVVPMTFDIYVYEDLDAGNIGHSTTECNGLSINQLVSITTTEKIGPASGGDPSAHYQWLYLAGTEDSKPTTAPGSGYTTGGDNIYAPWSMVEDETQSNILIDQSGWYCRAYVSECGTVYTDYIYATASTGANGATIQPISDSIHVCGNTPIPDNKRSIGSYPFGEPGYSYIVNVGNDTYTYNVAYQWQDSIPGTGGHGWQNITTNGTTPFYTIPATFSRSTFYRCLITLTENVGGSGNAGCSREYMQCW